MDIAEATAVEIRRTRQDLIRLMQNISDSTNHIQSQLQVNGNINHATHNMMREWADVLEKVAKLETLQMVARSQS